MRTAICLGNGQSLLRFPKDAILEAVKERPDIVTIGCNSIVDYMPVDYWISVEPTHKVEQWLDKKNCGSRWVNGRDIGHIQLGDITNRWPGTNFFWQLPIGEYCEEWLSTSDGGAWPRLVGGASGITAIDLAIKLRYDHIILIGHDYDGPYWWGNDEITCKCGHKSLLILHQMYKVHFKSSGARIFYCGDNPSMRTWYEPVTMGEALEMLKEKS